MFHEVEVLQSTSFPISCHDLKLTTKSLFAIGTYKPRIKIHSLSTLSVQSERYIQHDPLKIEPLTDTKLAILCTDRIIELHAKFGFHTSFRIPSCGRNIQFNKINADLIIQSDDSIYMFNLEEGRFKKPLICDDAVAMHLSTVNAMLMVTTDDLIKLYDYRCLECVGSIESSGVNSVQFSTDGINFCYNEGESVVFKDLRSNKSVYKVECSDKIRNLRFSDEYVCALGYKGAYFIKNGDVRWKIIENGMNTFDCDGSVVVLGYEDGNIKLFHNSEIESEPEWCRSLDLVGSRIKK